MTTITQTIDEIEPVHDETDEPDHQPQQLTPVQIASALEQNQES